MAITWIWTIIVVFSVVYGILTGSIDAVSTAALSGAADAVKLSLSICGVTCLWSGIMEIISRSGLAAALSRGLHPFLKRLFPQSRDNPDTMQAISANVSANMLGLGNAATPLGIKAVSLMKQKAHNAGATDDMCMLVVLNTASVQLIPSTAAALRASAGASAPFDILPAVWITSAVSVAAGVCAAKILRHFWRKT